MSGRFLFKLAALLALLTTGMGCNSPPPLLGPDVVEPVPDKAAWARLPRIAVQHGVVFRGQAGVSAFNLHNYLDHDGTQFVVMWTSGAVHEGEAGSRVMRAVSKDGLHWSTATFLTPPPPLGQRYIARGFWRRGNEVLALVSQDREGEYFGPDLKMVAFKPSAQADEPWTQLGTLAPGVITNYPPQRLADGQWFEISRDSRRRLGFMKGGVSAWNSWNGRPLPAPSARWELRGWPATAPEKRPVGERWKSSIRVKLPMHITPDLAEPVWWALPDGRLMALFRDAEGRRLYQAFGSPDGQTWTRPRRTNFPDANSKLAGQRLSNGLYVLVSNPRPEANERSPLVLSVSRDGLTFMAMAVLAEEPTKRREVGRSKTPGYQYPHLLEHDGRLYVGYSRNKEDIEVIGVSLRDIETVLSPAG